MQKKKIAILLPWLKIGGTNKVALRFMKELVLYCDVTLILSQKTGELMGEIPIGVKLIVDEMRSFKSILKEDIQNLRIKYIVQDILYYLRIKLGRDSVDNYLYLVQRHSCISELEFDCAISYHGQSPERLLNLIYRTKSKKKVAWIHGEIGFSPKKCHQLQKYYAKLDHIFFVSSPTKESFLRWFHCDTKLLSVYYNPLNKAEILEAAAEDLDTPYKEGCMKILTVGRISSEKGQDMIPLVAKKLKDSGYDICWYIIGDGEMRGRIETLIFESGVSDSVTILGVRQNPYCYMKECDIYVQPSYTEGYSTTICEAGILGKAIIGTKPSGGIKDQITDGVDGIICDANVSSIFEAIKLLADSLDLRQQFEMNILKKNFEGKDEIRKFLDFLEYEENDNFDKCCERP